MRAFRNLDSYRNTGIYIKEYESVEQVLSLKIIPIYHVYQPFLETIISSSTRQLFCLSMYKRPENPVRVEPVPVPEKRDKSLRQTNQMKDVPTGSQSRNYLSAAKARHKLGVCSKTLRNWDSKGLIQTVRTPTGIRLYDVSSIDKSKDDVTGTSRESGHRIIYARVSSAKQKEDLERQVQFMSSKFPGHKVVRDVGSGINWSRPGLKTVLRHCLQGSLRELVVAHRDKLSRLAFELLQFLVEEAGGKLVVFGESQDGSSGDRSEFRPESELEEDLLSIIHVFSSRHYGRRKYKKSSGDKPKPGRKPGGKSSGSEGGGNDETPEEDPKVQGTLPEERVDKGQENQDPSGRASA